MQTCYRYQRSFLLNFKNIFHTDPTDAVLESWVLISCKRKIHENSIEKLWIISV